MSQDTAVASSRLEKITEPDAIDGWIQQSHEQPVLFFKHSLTCPISLAAYQAYQAVVAGRTENDPVRFTLIEVQRARPTSKALAERLAVKHESPQAILVRNGEVQWHDSHWRLTEESLTEALRA
ncbi:MAG: bacillithiol system redox-active protein YtxJ [Acidobacteriota bacterium]